MVDYHGSRVLQSIVDPRASPEIRLRPVTQVFGQLCALVCTTEGVAKHTQRA